MRRRDERRRGEAGELVVVLAAAAAFLYATGSAHGHTPRPVHAEQPAAVQVRRLEVNLQHDRGAVRFLEHRLHRRRAGQAVDVVAVRELRWHRRAIEWQQHRLDAVVVRLDWLDAVDLVDRHLGHGAWLRSCSQPTSEGGWGRWVPNTQGSGAGGWLQFMPGTFADVIGGAVVRARRHGLVVPPAARSWYSPLGQAVAGVEMLERGRVSEWTGWGCS